VRKAICADDETTSWESNGSSAVRIRHFKQSPRLDPKETAMPSQFQSQAQAPKTFDQSNYLWPRDARKGL